MMVLRGRGDGESLEASENEPVLGLFQLLDLGESEAPGALSNGHKGQSPEGMRNGVY